MTTDLIKSTLIFTVPIIIFFLGYFVGVRSEEQPRDKLGRFKRKDD